MARAAARQFEFAFEEGMILARKYEVLSFLGSGWEGEVYLVREVISDSTWRT